MYALKNSDSVKAFAVDSMRCSSASRGREDAPGSDSAKDSTDPFSSCLNDSSYWLCCARTEENMPSAISTLAIISSFPAVLEPVRKRVHFLLSFEYMPES